MCDYERDIPNGIIAYEPREIAIVKISYGKYVVVNLKNQTAELRRHPPYNSIFRGMKHMKASGTVVPQEDEKSIMDMVKKII